MEQSQKQAATVHTNDKKATINVMSDSAGGMKQIYRQTKGNLKAKNSTNGTIQGVRELPVFVFFSRFPSIPIYTLVEMVVGFCDFS